MVRFGNSGVVLGIEEQAVIAVHLFAQWHRTIADTNGMKKEKWQEAWEEEKDIFSNLTLLLGGLLPSWFMKLEELEIFIAEGRAVGQGICPCRDTEQGIPW